MNYKEVHDRCFSEGFKAAEDEMKNKNTNTDNPYEDDLLTTHYEHSAWLSGYWWYLTMVY